MRLSQNVIARTPPYSLDKPAAGDEAISPPVILKCIIERIATSNAEYRVRLAMTIRTSMRKPILRFGKDKIVYNGRFMQTICRPFINTKTKERGVWELVRRKTYGRIVAVEAITTERRIILTKIYRVPPKAWVIEAPAGLADKKGESDEALARRELLEETGYSVKRLKPIMAGYFNAGMLEDELVYFLGTGAKKVQEPEHEDAEDIEVITVPISRFERFLKHPPEGMKIDLKLHALVPFLKRF